jgi:hypothetical protein
MILLEMNGNRYQVTLGAVTNEHVVQVVKTRRTNSGPNGLEYRQTLKPGSNLWKRAVRNAIKQLATGGSNGN